MAWLIVAPLLILLAGFLFLVGRGSTGDDKVVPYTLGVIALLGVVVWTALASATQVKAGHVAVVYQFGSIVGQKPEGLQFIAPWQSSKEASIQVQKYRFERVSESVDNTILAFSAETQDVFINATLNYQVNPDAIQNLYRNVGPNWFEKLVQARVFQIFKDETVKYRSVDIAPAREEIRIEVRNRIRAELAPYSINVVDLLIDNIDFRKEFKDAIEAKQIATQDALRSQEVIRQKQAEAEQRRAEAQGIADATVIEAKGQAEANRELSASITPNLVQWQAVQKLGDNIQIALVPSGQGIIIDPATLLKGTTP